MSTFSRQTNETLFKDNLYVDFVDKHMKGVRGMRITNLLDKNAIMLNAGISDKNEAINTLIEMHDKAGNLSDKEKYRAGILAREAESTTAVGVR